MKRPLSTFCACLVLASTVSAADWGTISGKVVLKGAVPDPVLIHAKGANIKDKEVCAAEDTLNNDLVVNKDTNGIANVFIYLYKAPKDIHPDAVNVAPRVIFDQEKCMFKPHAMVLQAGQTVEVLNSDKIAHNTHTYPLRNQQVNILVSPLSKKGMGQDIATTTREPLPHQVKCDYHSWMMAYWLVLDHPYAAVTDAKGEFKIHNLPVGEHEFRVWQERVGYLDRKYKVTVKAGENDPLKPIEVALSQLEEK